MKRAAEVRRRLTPALGALLVGVGLAVASLPGVVELLVSDPGRRALTPERLLDLAGHHVVIAATGLAAVSLLGIGLGILVTRPSAAIVRSAVDGAAAVAQGVPPVVVVALALPVLGFGGPPTLLALVAYGVMPTLRATAGALEAVSADAKDAAVALGLTPNQVLMRVELPLASHAIVGAVRVALVLAVATTAVGALAGAATLGTPIVAGLQNQNVVPMLQGASATAALAFLGDALVLAAAGWMRRN